MIIRVLSLKTEKERRDVISRELLKYKLDFQFSDGVNGLTVEIPRHPESRITSPEAACSLGHLRIYEELIESNQEWGLIFEDDVTLSHDFGECFKEIEKEIFPICNRKSTIILLGMQKGLRSHHYFVGKVIGRIGERKIFKSYRSTQFLFGTFGYLINRSAARKILFLNQDLIYKADDWFNFEKAGALDQILLLRPGIVLHPEGTEHSLIHNSRLKNRPNLNSIGKIHSKVAILFRILKFSFRLAASKIF